ncbi:MAG TPA: SRPBCC domain-containing protein [Arachidicoccus sp.]
MTKYQPLIIEQELNASIKEVWRIITDLYEMRNWYFYLDEFKPDIGYSFHFLGGDKENQYVHLCIVTKIVDEKILSHTWRYKDYDGDSQVQFELSRRNNKTLMTLTHTGIEHFAKYGENFSRTSFKKMWQHIITVSLKGYIGNR